MSSWNTMVREPLCAATGHRAIQQRGPLYRIGPRSLRARCVVRKWLPDALDVIRQPDLATYANCAIQIAIDISLSVPSVGRRMRAAEPAEGLAL
jgi:hypothetical protein